uniref:Protein arginine N-methyltransferase 3 C2H2 zinc finger domain-containing protein n=1 Tax=Pavo cristatus TaxID=9049 RepID=A0A8C9FG68_PAVCR
MGSRVEGAARPGGFSARAPSFSLFILSVSKGHCSVPAGPARDDEMAELSEGEEAWEEEEQGAGEGLRARCLFCDRWFCSPEDVFCHCTTEHQFNVRDVVRKHAVSFSALKPMPAYLNSLSTPLPWDGEEYLKPQLEDDLLLQFGN